MSRWVLRGLEDWLGVRDWRRPTAKIAHPRLARAGPSVPPVPGRPVRARAQA